MGAASAVALDPVGTTGQWSDKRTKDSQDISAALGNPLKSVVDPWGNLIGANGRPVNPFGLTPSTPKGFYDGQNTVFDSFGEGFAAWEKSQKARADSPESIDKAAIKALQPLDMADIVLRAADKVKTTTGYAGSFLTGPAENPVDRAARKFSQEKLILDAAKLRGLK